MKPISIDRPLGAKYHPELKNKFAAENTFKGQPPENADIPVFSEIKDRLPKPIWEGQKNAIDAYYRAWEICFAHIWKPDEGTGFIKNYVDCNFGGCLFMWDASFMLMFGKYAKHIFNFQNTLDNFYAKQHGDGFISRQLIELSGEETFEEYDPTSTGPNIMPWCEWEYYLNFGDKQRLERIFPCLMAYHEWLRLYRTWQDGSYWSCGWACGMDNQPRIEQKGENPMEEQDFHHGFATWIDACLQQIISGKVLVKMARVIGRESDVAEIESEVELLSDYVNNKMWDDKTSYYYDRFRDGRLNGVKTIGSYWALLADVVPEERLQGFIQHLENENEFKRPHRVPSLSYDHPWYDPHGDYWRGGVWSSTNYMVIKGLQKNGRFDTAFDIALNNVLNVAKVFETDETLYENYAPEYIKRGGTSYPEYKDRSRVDFVGWTGLTPISIMFEGVFGIIPNVENNRIDWHINLTEKHGIENYPFGDKGFVTLICEQRLSPDEEPKVTVKGDIDVAVNVVWNGTSKIIKCEKQ